MWVERLTRYCPQCDDYVEIRDELADRGPLDHLFGTARAWECPHCSGPVPLTPEDTKRRIGYAVLGMSPAIAAALLGVAVLVKWALGW
jgi:hypothetical protein